MFLHKLAYLETWLRTLRDRDEGQGMVEYGIVVALIALVAVGAVAAVGTGVFNSFTNAAAQLP